MTGATKVVRIGYRDFTIRGVSATDPYLTSISDGFEDEFRLFCGAFLEPNYVCLDIGANIGIKSLMLSQFVPRGRVIAVEAAPGVAKVLAENVQGEANVHVVHSAIAERDGTVKFLEHSAWGHIAPSGMEVPARRLASIVAEQNLTRLDFVKLDVEGYEYPILKDAIETINAYRTLVFFEFNSWAQLTASEVHPLEFSEWITAHFCHVYLLRRSDRTLTRVARGRDGAYAILHANVTADGSVTDVVATNAHDRLLPQSLNLEPRPSAAQRAQEVLSQVSTERDAALLERDAAAQARDNALLERDAAAKERDAAAKERDAAVREIGALRSSTSWRASAPIRSVGRLMRGL